ncbi:hypothetical protein SOCE26_086290 [Sorangium cellulosum]|uniref:Uncharacterized protein n=1 Tax=Sorangium cellulosum TaxID=56 RepID=A0A2L0F6H1_SORCE|nr:hypothetical protein [Sorangium cellulosum]AUX47117.1 hypothetical protein SOCE26_086290 [Sorangium cellulosum]
MLLRTAARLALGLALCLALLGAVCGACGQGALGVMPGVVNDPGNLSLRRAILAFATSQLCTEMQRRSVPLRLRDDDPVTGRFYPSSCVAQELANGNLFLQFGGSGVIWTNLTKRMGFDASAAVEYDHDFLMDGDTMYVYFRQRSTTAASFTTRLIEQPAAVSLGGVSLAQGSAYANALGAQLVKTEIARGFTVIRDDDGAVQLGLGVIEKGQRPRAPYERRDNGKLLLANERTEVHQNQRDYIGPLEITDSGQAVTLTIALEGAPGVDVILVPRILAEQWLQVYLTQPAPTPPPTPPLYDEPVYSGAPWRRTLPLPKGQYYLVVDNTSAAGRTQPTTYALDDRAALVSYAVEVGDAP